MHKSHCVIGLYNVSITRVLWFLSNIHITSYMWHNRISRHGNTCASKHDAYLRRKSTRLIATYAPISAIKKLTLFLRTTMETFSSVREGAGRGGEERRGEEISKLDRWWREPLSVRAGWWPNRRPAEIRSDWPFLRSRWTIGIVRLKYLWPRIDDVDRNCVNRVGMVAEIRLPIERCSLPVPSPPLLSSIYLGPLSMYRSLITNCLRELPFVPALGETRAAVFYTPMSLCEDNWEASQLLLCLYKPLFKVSLSARELIMYFAVAVIN